MEYRGRPAQIELNFLLKLYFYLPKENNERKLCQGVRDTSLCLLSTPACLLVMEFRYDAILCFNLGNENSDAGHIECSRGSQVPNRWSKSLAHVLSVMQIQ